jgi:phosphate transport system protein
MQEAHTDRTYVEELKQLRGLIVRMGGEVSDMLARSLLALGAGDASLARAVIAADPRINTLEVEVDELCMRIIARRQPVASDLRFIATSLKLDTDLERVGDLCVDMCQRVLDLGRPVDGAAGAALRTMGDRVREMVETAVQAFLGADVGLAKRVLESDGAVEDAYRRLFEGLLERMRAASLPSEDGVRLQAAGRYLERIGAHATNVAEMAIFYARGRDVRHPGRVAGADARRASIAPLARGARFAVAATGTSSGAASAPTRGARPSVVSG